MLRAMQKDMQRFIPATGFNVVGVDDFEPPGEQLYLISHHDDQAGAEAALEAFQARSKGDKAYIYPSTMKLR